MKQTLEERVRYLIGQEGPQLPSDEYEARIDGILEAMTPGELLSKISLVLEDGQ
jgi:hypothetical protein